MTLSFATSSCSQKCMLFPPRPRPFLAVTAPAGLPAPDSLRGLTLPAPCVCKQHRNCVLARAGPFDWLSSLGKGASVPDVRPAKEEEEAGTMRSLDGMGEPCGVQAVLLAGFMSQQEVSDFQALMDAMEATMFKVIPATKSMLQGTLREALEVSEVPAYEQPPLGTRRTIILSGMYDGEVIEVVSAYRESGQPPAVFAAAVPNNLDRQLSGLVTEVHKEDAAMRQQLRG